MIFKNRKFIVMLIFLFIASIGSAQNTIIRGFDPEEGKTLEIQEWAASSFLTESGKPADEYGPFKAIDYKYNTAWCEGGKGPGIGEWIKFDFSEWYSYSRLSNVYRILIINGLAANKDLYFANNRVKKLEVEFSEGEKRIIELKDGVLDYQKFIFHIKAKWIKLKILDVYKGSKFDDTCISEVDFETTTHPCDLTPKQRQTLKENGVTIDYELYKCKN